MEQGSASATPNFAQTQQQLSVNVVTQNQSNAQQHTFSLSADSYEEVFKEITKKLYGDDQGFAELIDATGNVQQANIIYDADTFRTDLGSQLGNVTFLAGPNGTALPPGTIVLQRKLCQDKDGRLWSMDGEQVTLVPEQQVVHTTTPSVPTTTTTTATPSSTPSGIEERWFESEEVLSWTTSKIARYNPSQKVFRCVDCDFVGFLSRVAEHWLGNHASLRVFQCPRCPYTSAWARCVRMHLTRQHGETVNDNSMWKENPVLEEVTKFLGSLKSGVETRVAESTDGGDRRYLCPHCPYSTDRRDLYNRHENIHRDDKPFICYVCDKQFNRADHVKKHFTRMHRDHPYDINKIKKYFLSKQAAAGVVPYSKIAKQQQPKIEQQHELIVSEMVQALEQGTSTIGPDSISLQLEGTNQAQQIPHIAYFNPPSTPGQNGPLQGIAGVGGTKKESKSKGVKKKKVGEKMYTCSYCPWQGVDNWCLKRHLNTHIKPFLCSLCDYKAARSERLSTHVLKVHNKRVCHKCSFLADDTDALSQHIQDAHQNPLVKTGFNCNVCQEYFEQRADLEAHAILEHQKVIVQCDLCDFRTTDELSMEAHLREKHNLQPGMGAVAAAAAAAAVAAGQPNPTQYQMQIPTQTQMQLPDPLTLEAHSILMNNNGEQLSQSDTMSPITFQQDANGKFESINVQTSGDNTTVDETSQSLLEEGAMLVEPEPETLCEKCGLEFADEASLKLHEKRHFVEEPILQDADWIPKLKSLSRSYVCSTCSYTAPTKKIMMQHQRAHNGLELICKAEGCFFLTPFDNTLKEHINSEHASEPNVRCPHCGLRIPSTNAFTYHWRAHHPALCSLCVNLYRVKYGIKENDLHDLISKSMLQLLNEELDVNKPKPVIQIHSNLSQDPSDESPLVDEQVNFSSNSTAEEQSRVKPDNSEEDVVRDTSLDDCLNNNNTSLVLSSTTPLEETEDQQPPTKKPRIEEILVDFSPIVQAVDRRKARESLKIIPNLSEVLVTPVMLVQQLKRPSVHPCWKKWRRIYHPSRRLVSRSIPAWLCVWRKREGKRCYHVGCRDTPTPRSFKKKSGFILHNIWQHSIPTHKCDNCPLEFHHLYQAVMHKMRDHQELVVFNQEESQNNQQATVFKTELP